METITETLLRIDAEQKRQGIGRVCELIGYYSSTASRGEADAAELLESMISDLRQAVGLSE